MSVNSGSDTSGIATMVAVASALAATLLPHWKAWLNHRQKMATKAHPAISNSTSDSQNGQPRPLVERVVFWFDLFTSSFGLLYLVYLGSKDIPAPLSVGVAIQLAIIVTTTLMSAIRLNGFHLRR